MPQCECCEETVDKTCQYGTQAVCWDCYWRLEREEIKKAGTEKERKRITTTAL